MVERKVFRALVVEDDLEMQEVVVHALVQEGFACDTAADGKEAESRVARAQYDVVIADLRMPNENGHVLALHLLEMPRRPVIVVHTGVLVPRLAKDLLARGVDDILFKPFDISILAAKARALVERRSASAAQDSGNPKSPERVADDPQLHEQRLETMPVSLANIESKLSGLSRILPISRAGLDVYNMTHTDQFETPQIAAAIQRDATLAAEVLRLANSAFYNTTRQRIVQLERAVVQIGQKRIGELALATNALTALTSGMVTWLNVELTWKRSMMAGLAIEMLIEKGKHQQAEQGLLLSAIMHPLGRVVLGTLYPKQYETMVENCRRQGDTLQDQERKVFPISHAEVISHLLSTWSIPDDIHAPFKHMHADYASLGNLSEQFRFKIELLKLAIVLGDMAIGQWESWDAVDLPSATLLKKMGVTSLSAIIQHIKRDVGQFAAFRTDQPKTNAPAPLPEPSRELAYCDLSDSPFDFLSEIVSLMGIKIVKYSEGDLNDLEETVLVNCVGTAPQWLADKSRRASRQLIIVTDSERIDRHGKNLQAIVLPASYARLRSTCWEASHSIMQTSSDPRLTMFL